MTRQVQAQRAPVDPLADPRDATGERRTLAATLAAAAAELRSMRESAARIEDAAGVLVAFSDPRSIAAMRDLQELDRLRQHLDGLAEFLQALSTERAAEATVDLAPALGRLRLERLSRALSGAAPAEPGEDDGFELL